MADAIERSVKRLHLDCQGEFIAIINAIAVQLESPDPEPAVVRLLADSLRALAPARRLDEQDRQRLGDALDRLIEHVEAPRASSRER
jgi:hypothetical protein